MRTRTVTLWDRGHSLVIRSSQKKVVTVHLFLRYLVIVRPLANGIKVLAFVFRHKVWERGIDLVDPDLTKDIEVCSAHDLLTENIEAVTWDAQLA